MSVVTAVLSLVALVLAVGSIVGTWFARRELRIARVERDEALAAAEHWRGVAVTLVTPPRRPS